MLSPTLFRLIRIRKKAIKGFTLVELIVVITILAILATVGFLSLSGYSDDARTATVKANVRTVYSAILTESTTSGNSPRYYVDHGTGAALSWAFVFVDGKQVALTGGNVGEAPADSNYSAGNPRWDRLRMNGDKFKLAVAGVTWIQYAFGGFGTLSDDAAAAYSTGELAVGAVDVFKVGANGRKRATPYFQVAGVVPGSKATVVSGNFAGGTAGGLIKDPGSSDPAYSLADGIPSASPIPENCKAAKAANPSAGDGTYRIDPDGAGTGAAISVYCDMTTEWGGWTLIAKSQPNSNAHADVNAVGTLSSPDQSTVAKLSDATINSIPKTMYRMSNSTRTFSVYFDTSDSFASTRQVANKTSRPGTWSNPVWEGPFYDSHHRGLNTWQISVGNFGQSGIDGATYTGMSSSDTCRLGIGIGGWSVTWCGPGDAATVWLK